MVREAALLTVGHYIGHEAVVTLNRRTDIQENCEGTDKL